MKLRLTSAAVAVAILSLAVVPASAGRFQTYTKRFKENADQAKVISSTYLGGSGTEWLVGGGFQPDGSITLVGTSLGPQLSIAGKDADVIGTDLRAPNKPERRVEMRRGKPRRNRDGTLRYHQFSWEHENATAFIVRMGKGAGRVRKVLRLPWAVAGATAAECDKSGNLYFTGIGDAKRFSTFCQDVKEMKTPKVESKLKTRTVYVAKMPAGSDEIAWVRHYTGPAEAPNVGVTDKGTVVLRGVDIRTLDKDGKVVGNTVVPGGLSRRVAVNRKDGTYAYGHEHHWGTGREPWRCPVLKIYRPNGDLLYHLYDWGGPYVGLNNLRLVSDSAVRGVTYDSEGNLVINAWSDGGNSVMTRQPNDVRRGADKMKGLGMSAWGAGVLSCSYIVKIETTDYKVIGGGLWLSYLSERDKPNSVAIKELSWGPNGEIVIGGRSARGLIQTGNNLNTGEIPGGPYVTCFNEDMTSIRFSSIMNACGAVDINNGANWRFIRGFVDGKPRLLALTGAQAKEGGYNDGATAPTVRALQKSFGGGHLDGHLLLLDMSK
ncbi:MAG: hypothetical protein ACLFVU_07955 [Phycisphaerae bacterium]